MSVPEEVTGQRRNSGPLVMLMSGAAIAYWDEGLWRELAEFVTRT